MCQPFQPTKKIGSMWKHALDFHGWHFLMHIAVAWALTAPRFASADLQPYATHLSKRFAASFAFALRCIPPLLWQIWFKDGVNTVLLGKKSWKFHTFRVRKTHRNHKKCILVISRRVSFWMQSKLFESTCVQPFYRVLLLSRSSLDTQINSK